MTLFKRFNKYNFEIKHLLVLFGVLVAFEIILFFVFKASLNTFVVKTQDWYQRFSAARMANLTTTTMELLTETTSIRKSLSVEESSAYINKFNIVFSQQLLEKNVNEICLFLFRNNNIYIIDNGKVLFDAFYHPEKQIPPPERSHTNAIEHFGSIKVSFMSEEGIKTIIEDDETFHTFVPFVPNGEFIGALYMKNTPNFSNITMEFISKYDDIAIIFTFLILLGLLAMYLISSYTVQEKNRSDQLYYDEKQKHIRDQIEHEKEFVFTKRIYHANHKAEKIMGFIQQDIRNIKENDEIKHRIMKYSNFISRIIYDMKWYDPPIHSIRGQIYNTNVNEVITFIVKNLFQRVSVKSQAVDFQLQLDETVPSIHVNEFVIWEILEPLIQNSLTHNKNDKVTITISTKYDKEVNKSYIIIKDNGKGIRDDLLETDEHNTKKLFLENISTRQSFGQHFGYGCFLAYQMAKKRCGWDLDVENVESGGCQFILSINH